MHNNSTLIVTLAGKGIQARISILHSRRRPGMRAQAAAGRPRPSLRSATRAFPAEVYVLVARGAVTFLQAEPSHPTHVAKSVPYRDEREGR